MASLNFGWRFCFKKIVNKRVVNIPFVHNSFVHKEIMLGNEPG